MMEFTFEVSGWELALDALGKSGSLSAARFLALMEQESEDAFEDALAMLESRDVLLDVADLPQQAGGGELALRLRLEKQLVEENRLPEGLDENDPLRLYLQELAGMPVCGDPQVLAGNAADGDDGSRQMLLGLMLGWVVQYAYAQAGKGVLLMDLIQEGSMAAWQAILEYSGGEFEPVCHRYIRRAMATLIVRQARQNGVGQRMRRALEDFRDADAQLLAQLGRNPTLEEIAGHANMTLEEAELVSQMLEAARTVSRVKETAAPKEESPEDQMAVEDTAYFQMRQRIGELLSALSEQDARLISLRYGLDGGLPLTPEQTGRKLGMTAQEVINAEATALAMLRNQ